MGSPERVEPEDLEAARLGVMALQEQIHRLRFNKFERTFPDEGPLSRHNYPKSIAFFEAGKTFKERCLMGGSRTGKTETGAYEATAHATGNYPEWWPGRTFRFPSSGLACGKSSKVVRDTVQVKLVGFPKGPFGSGMIPKELLIENECKRASGTADLLDIIAVKHRTGGKSIINLKSYDQGRESFEGTERDWIWEDEEADIAIHGENVARTMTTGGIVWNTYTPLKGQTDLTLDFERRSGGDNPSVFLERISWDDAAHITPAMIRAMEEIYPPHEMKARRWGIPKLGSGAIYTQPWEEVSVPPHRIEPHWPRAYGLDFGWTHPTGALWLAWDRDEDVCYAYSEHRRAEAKPGEHVIAIQARGDWIRGASETAGGNLEDGKRMMNIYRGLGLHLVAADKSVWSGIEDIRQALATDKLKFFNTLHMLREEYESYQTDEKGKIVKKRDDLLDALRYVRSKYREIARVEPPKRGTTVTDVKPIKFAARKLY